MSFKFLFKIFIFSFIFQYSQAQDDFLNTVDGEYYSLVSGTGSERGFYFQVTQIFDEKVLPKNSLIPGQEIIPEDVIQSALILLEPKLEFLNNTAECEIFQGPYYSTNDMVAGGTEVTFAYIIQAKSDIKNKSCKIKVLSSDSQNTLREIDYYTQSEEAP